MCVDMCLQHTAPLEAGHRRVGRHAYRHVPRHASVRRATTRGKERHSSAGPSLPRPFPSSKQSPTLTWRTTTSTVCPAVYSSWCARPTVLRRAVLTFLRSCLCAYSCTCPHTCPSCFSTYSYTLFGTNICTTCPYTVPAGRILPRPFLIFNQ